jgi:endonuclease/exonuclease/phosphatase family metal-dependent hydrolase
MQCRHRIYATLLGLLAPMLASGAETNCKAGSAPPRVHEGETLKVATLNIAHGRGEALNQMLIGRERIEQNLERAAGLLAGQGVDVVALQELDVDSRWAGSFDHAARLMSAAALDCAALGLHAQTWLYRFGTGLLSRVQLTDPKVTSFEPTPPTTTKGLVSATVQWLRHGQASPVRVVSVHLDFSRGSARRRQLTRIIEAVKSSPVPFVIMGDFNEAWDTETSVVRSLVEEAGMKAYAPDSDGLATYGSSRLDWILVSPELEFSSYRVLAEAVSDHRLVVADLRWSAAP